MIRVGPLSRTRVHAACLALRIRWVEELERQRDGALARARGLEVERDQLRRIGETAVAERDQALAKLERTQRSYDVTSRAYGAASCDLVAVDRKRAEAESERERADREVRQLRDVLAPDLDPGDTPLADVARAALASARSTAVAAELRWWAGQRHLEHETLLARAAHLDPAGATPTAAEELTPSIFRAPTDDEVAAEVRAAGGLPREAYDPAMGGDIEPPPGRAWPPLVHGLGCECERCTRAVVVDADIRCGGYADGNLECGGETGHAGSCWPDPRALARAVLVEQDIAQGVVAAAAAQVLDDAHQLTDRGKNVDGDMLAQVIGEGLPTQWDDQACRATADRILDCAVAAGFTVLHGPDLHARVVEEVPF